MDVNDYYKVMGVASDASAQEIKTAYRRLARQYHPDLNKDADAEAKFKNVGAAYEVLKDPKKRAEYDQGRLFESRSSAAHAGSHSGFEDIDPDWLSSLFGGARFHEQAHRGADIQGRIRISLEQAFSGCVQEIQLEQDNSRQTLRVSVPAGVKNEQKIRLAGKGAPDHRGGSPGDLYITVTVDAHPFFDVVGQDIYLTLPVTPWEVALGGTVMVPTLAGKVELKIPARSQGGNTLRLKKRGLPGKNPGDQYIILKVLVPEPHTDAEISLYKSMAETMPFNPRQFLGV